MAISQKETETPGKMEAPAKSGLSELEKTFQEYKSKLENAEREAQEIVDLAWQRAEALITEKQKEAQQLAAEAQQKARQEADRFILAAQAKAEEIEREAENRARREARDRTKKEIDKLIADNRKSAEKHAAEITAQAKRDADAVIEETRENVRREAQQDADAIISAAVEKAQGLDANSVERADEIIKLVADVSDRAEQIVQYFCEHVQHELSELSTMVSNAKNHLETRAILEQSSSMPAPGGENGVNGKGRRELNIMSPYSMEQVKRLVEFLKQMPAVKLDGQAATEDDFSIYLNVVEPVPLVSILQQLSLVESSDLRGDIIRLKFKPGSN